MSRLYFKKENEAYTYLGKFKYLIVFNNWCGRRDRYEIYILTSSDPVVIGRELPMKDVRRVISEYEILGPTDWFGDREAVLKFIDFYRKVSK